MKTIDEQIEHMKMEIIEWSGITSEGEGCPYELDLCLSILDTLEKVKAGQISSKEGI